MSSSDSLNAVESGAEQRLAFDKVWKTYGLDGLASDATCEITIKPPTVRKIAENPAPSDTNDVLEEEHHSKKDNGHVSSLAVYLLPGQTLGTQDSGCISNDSIAIPRKGETQSFGSSGELIASYQGIEEESDLVSEQGDLTEAHSVAISFDDKALSEGDLELFETLGKGGMGLVRRARQISLRREVAVKSLRKRYQTLAAREELLREAWITGLLEHPNIVPIHAIRKSPKGELQIVMKRISGTVWRSIIHEPEHPHRPENIQDPLEWHLRILVQVCNAVHYAHSRGIIHRDLKPENVMIGDFGEVYVLDWGIALCLEDLGDEVLNVFNQSIHIVGTPAYMAPEMIDMDMLDISPQTDVYLLGAILHELITGKAPHFHDSLYDSMCSAYESNPREFGPDVPPELAAICNKAMHKLPSERFQSAEDFRQAIQHFLQHRSSNILVKDAQERLVYLRADKTPAMESTPEQRTQIYKLFTECHFGFRQALKIWENNAEALKGFREASEWMIRYELEREDLEAARVLLADIGELSEELQKRFQELEEKLEKEHQEYDALQEKLEHAERQYDANVSSHSRGRVAMALGIIWWILPMAYHFVEKSGYFQMTHQEYIIKTFVFAGVLGILVYTFKDPLFATHLNRRVIGMLGLCFVALLTSRVGGTLMGLELHRVVALDMLVVAMVVASMAIAFDKKLIGSIVPYGLGFLLGSYWIEYAYIALAFANLFGLNYMAYVWSQKRAEPLVTNA